MPVALLAGAARFFGATPFGDIPVIEENGLDIFVGHAIVAHGLDQSPGTIFVPNAALDDLDAARLSHGFLQHRATGVHVVGMHQVETVPVEQLGWLVTEDWLRR